MSTAPRRRVDAALDFLAAPRLRQALTVVIVASSFATDALRVVYGLPGEIAVLVGLVVLAALSLLGMRDQIGWRGILPVSLLALAAWVVLSVLWSEYPGRTLPAAAGFAATAFLGVYVAIARDLIQLVRAIGDALRAILVVSLVLEVLSGILIDTPLPFLGIAGNLAEGGPIQGIAGSRNRLGFLAGIGIVTFLVEWRTRSVTRSTSLVSLGIAALLVVFSGSPVTAVVLAGVGLAALALWGLRRMPERIRSAVQPVLLVAAGVAALVLWALRSRILSLLNATGDFEVRTARWRAVLELVRRHPVEGWGWIGEWPRLLFPYTTIPDAGGRSPSSALNAYVDVMLQLGLVGAVLFCLALGLGIVRAWLVASESRSTVAVWPALILLLLAATSFAESYALTEGGLVLFVAACIAAARKRSWRRHLP